MLHNNFEVRVLVKGRPINEFPHNGQVFVEGRDGSNFEIEFKNLTHSRVEAVLSVDGVSVIDGEEAGPASSGYVVEPYGTVSIPGWKLTDEQVAAFRFSGKKGSYAAQTTGSARNTGVIGAMVFAEKPQYQGYRGIVRSMAPLRATFGSGIQSGGYVHTGSAADVIGASIHPGVPAGGYGAVGGGMTTSLGQIMVGGAAHNSWGNETVQLASGHSVSNNMAYSAEVERKTKGGLITESMAPVVEQTLGTAFGEATDFATTEVTFQRGDLAALMVLYYDDSRGLRARGIEVTRKKQRVVPAVAPEAFPGLKTKGCKPPVGWKG
jgi:hypothetical protein